MKKLNFLMISLSLIVVGSSALEYDTNAVLKADAGPDSTLHLSPSNNATFLDGSLSISNPNNDGIVNYEWYEGSQYIGPSASRWYVLPTIGEHNITLKVMDSDGDVSYDNVIVTVEDGLQADAGNDYVLNVTPSNTAVFLDGSGSVAGITSNGIVKYEWFTADGTFIGNGATRWYVLPENGEHTITLRITDTNGNTIEDTMVVTVHGIPELLANAGEDRTLSITPSNTAILLDGSTSFAPSGTNIVSYKWYDGSRFIGPSAIRWYVPHGNGQHNIKLVVTDDQGNSSEDSVVITVENSPTDL